MDATMGKKRQRVSDDKKAEEPKVKKGRAVAPELESKLAILEDVKDLQQCLQRFDRK